MIHKNEACEVLWYINLCNQFVEIKVSNEKKVYQILSRGCNTIFNAQGKDTLFSLWFVMTFAASHWCKCSSSNDTGLTIH